MFIEFRMQRKKDIVSAPPLILNMLHVRMCQMLPPRHVDTPPRRGMLRNISENI